MSVAKNLVHARRISDATCSYHRDAIDGLEVTEPMGLDELTLEDKPAIDTRWQRPSAPRMFDVERDNTALALGLIAVALVVTLAISAMWPWGFAL